MRQASFGVVLLMAAACSPTQRAVVGGGVAAVGLGVTGLSLESMASSCNQETEPFCSGYQEPARASEGLPGVFAGLGIALLGGVIMTTSVAARPVSPSRAVPAPAPPEHPPFDQAEAVAIVVARVTVAQPVVVGINRQPKPVRLLGVDDTHTSLRVEGRHAELLNLRVRAASDGRWRTVGACFEYESEWRVTSLGATSGCAR